MNLKELQECAKGEAGRFAAHYKVNERERILSMTLKLQEETGELADAVLYRLRLQSDWKLANLKPSVEEELADVIMTAAVIAAEIGVDLDDALKKQARKFAKRREEK
jgi:NTP pyrophosphatase (non-canonical NTP hydrolase)